MISRGAGFDVDVILVSVLSLSPVFDAVLETPDPMMMSLRYLCSCSKAQHHHISVMMFWDEQKSDVEQLHHSTRVWIPKHGTDPTW